MLSFKNKKVTVMGLGLYQEGSGISATRFLLSQGAKVTVTDLKTEKELAPQIKRLLLYCQREGVRPIGLTIVAIPGLKSGVDKPSKGKVIKFVLGQHREEDFKKTDLIIKNPAVPKTSKYLTIARANGIPIETDISLFFKLTNRKQIIGITGTRGKSTTTTLIYEILLSASQPAIIGGNIRKSPLTQLNKMKNNDLAVLELSSWLLESLEDAKLSSHLSVFTNIYPDHLNTYSDIDDYAAAKENIFKWQNLQDYAVLNFDNKYTRAMGRRVPAKRFWFSLSEFPEENGCFVKNNNIYFRLDGIEEKVLAVSDIKIIGEHNVPNVLAAVGAVRVLGLKSEKIKKAVANFKGLSDRLEFLRQGRGGKNYNDTTSTTPEATIAALKALRNSPPVRGGARGGGGGIGNFSVAPRSLSLGRGENNIILIAGGADKGLDFRALVKEIKKTCKSLVLLKGTGTEKIKKLLEIKNKKLEIGDNNSRVVSFESLVAEVDSISEAVKTARKFANKGDIILLSPACVSFGLFKNEFDRGDQFRKIINKLK